MSRDIGRVDELQSYTLVVARKRKQRKIEDLASKHNLNQNVGDEEWTPASKHSQNRAQRPTPKLKFSHKNDQPTNLPANIEKKKLNAAPSYSLKSSIAIMQTGCQQKMQVKKKTTTKKKSSSGVKDRLRKKFGCR